MEQVCVLSKGATMKKEIQPNYVEVKFVCACGAEFVGKTSKPGVLIGKKGADIENSVVLPIRSFNPALSA